MVKIRLSRLGAKRRPFYRLIAIDSRARRDGRPLEYLGTYDPVSKDKALQIDLEKVDAWVAQGAQLSETARSLVHRARLQPAPVAPAAPAETAAAEASS